MANNSPKHHADRNSNFTRQSNANYHRRNSIELATMGFSPYELPISANPEAGGLDDYSLPSINTITTSLEYGDRDVAQTEARTDCESNPRGQMSHGFFLGAASMELLHRLDDNDSEKENSNDAQFLDDDDGDFLEDDEGIAGIYSSDDVDQWVRSSVRSFKPSPEISKREVLSKRIKDVGFIGQNLGIGHLTGVWKEDAALIPNTITLKTTTLHISEQSPVQTDLCWDAPENASTFSSLMYNVDVMLPEQEVWTALTTVRFPVFRTYHTDHKLFLGKQKVDRQDHDLTIWLRVCCQGEVTQTNGAKHWTRSSWSKETRIVFLGYQTQPVVVEQTAL